MSSIIYKKLLEMLGELNSVVVAYSGGVDSSLLMAAAHDALGERALAVTGSSPTLPAHDFQSAKRFASDIGARWITVETKELENPLFSENTSTRCYYCKKILFTKLLEIAREKRFAFVIDGSNREDLDDYRPGLMAIKELGIRSPFVELDIGKEDIRQMARSRGLVNWDQPASACLSSRIPYGERISKERLDRIGRSESFLREMGFRQVRVRDHGVLARIEVIPEDLFRIIGENMRDEVINGCRAAGYIFVTIDLQGYRTGAMNETLKPPQQILTKLPEVPLGNSY